MKSELGQKIRQGVNIVADDKSNYEHKRSSNIHRPDFGFLARRRNAHKQGYRQSCDQQDGDQDKDCHVSRLPIMVLR